ncbi:MAG: hypothetical protein JO107_14715 [Hyphomicrobiales bacterium]|nr:hypothetical protein [Hyphomicrobiales bacterium]MBV8664342.1 hypothetical protein [Hyphomicrobiales bacterium]
MTILLKAAAGLFAGAFVGVTGVAIWPQVEPVRPALEHPKLAAAFAKTPAPAPSPSNGPANAATPAAAVAAGDKAAMEKLAMALRGSAQGGDQAITATRVAATAPNSTDQALRLRAQGLVALASGDVASARAFLERAAEAGDGRSLLVLGDTYDPATLNRLGALGLRGDPARARDYYARALSAGVAAARDRIAMRDSQ